MTAEIHPTQKAIEEAIDRIARTPDGASLYVLLQRRVMRVLGTAEPGALQLDNGERLFATRLIDLMAKGIFESGGRTSSSTGGSGSSSEQPVVVPRAEPQRYAGRLSARDRISAGARVSGYDLPGTED
jgi:hypothetical protein